MHAHVATQGVRSLLSRCDPQADHFLFGRAHHSLRAHPVCVEMCGKFCKYICMCGMGCLTTKMEWCLGFDNSFAMR